MNEIERQLLENQSSIMFALSGIVAKAGSLGTSTNLDYQRDMTKRILNPKQETSLQEEMDKIIPDETNEGEGK